MKSKLLSWLPYILFVYDGEMMFHALFSIWHHFHVATNQRGQQVDVGSRKATKKCQGKSNKHVVLYYYHNKVIMCTNVVMHFFVQSMK